MTVIDTIVFDVGNVLIPWAPRRLFAKLLPDDGAIDRFVAETDFAGWNAARDAGGGFAEGIAEYGARFPQYRHFFSAFFARWEETLGAPIQASVDLARRLRALGYRTLALTNFSAETWPRAVRLHPFLLEFEGIVVSGCEGMIKPDPAIYRLLCSRYATPPERCAFIDDSLVNVEGARAIGMHAVHFRSAETLQDELAALGVRL